jgi:hypothetical protein
MASCIFGYEMLKRDRAGLPARCAVLALIYLSNTKPNQNNGLDRFHASHPQTYPRFMWIALQPKAA